MSDGYDVATIIGTKMIFRKGLFVRIGSFYVRLCPLLFEVGTADSRYMIHLILGGRFYFFIGLPTFILIIFIVILIQG